MLWRGPGPVRENPGQRLCAGAALRVTDTVRPALRSIEVTPAPRASTPGGTESSPGVVVAVHVEPSRSVEL